MGSEDGTEAMRVTGAEASLTGTEQILICLQEIERRGGEARMAELYEAVNRRLGATNRLSKQGEDSLREFINRKAAKKLGWVEPYDPDRPGWRITPEGSRELSRVSEEAGTATAMRAELDERTRTLALLGLKGRPAGNPTPQQTTTTTTTYVRDIGVRVHALSRANGVCEAHGGPAPFTRDDGSPYLEVHHIVPLAEGGPDTVENAAALCPDCHRAQHLAHDRAERRAQLAAAVTARESGR